MTVQRGSTYSLHTTEYKVDKNSPYGTYKLSSLLGEFLL